MAAKTLKCSNFDEIWLLSRYRCDEFISSIEILSRGGNLPVGDIYVTCLQSQSALVISPTTKLGGYIVFARFLIITIPQQSWESYCFSIVFYYYYSLFSYPKILSRAILINYLMELIETCNIDRWQCELV